MSHPTVCPECSAPMREEWQGHLYTGWHCSTPWVHEMQAELNDLRAKLTDAEYNAQEAETKLQAAEDAVVVLSSALHTAQWAITRAMLKGCDEGDANQIVEEALVRTSALAAQRKREIQREALVPLEKRILVLERALFEAAGQWCRGIHQKDQPCEVCQGAQERVFAIYKATVPEDRITAILCTTE